jgi:hypothetical protein
MTHAAYDGIQKPVYAQAEDIIYDQMAQHVGDLVRLFWNDDEGHSDDFYTDGVNRLKDFVLDMMEVCDRERLAGARQALLDAAYSTDDMIIDGGGSNLE